MGSLFQNLPGLSHSEANTQLNGFPLDFPHSASLSTSPAPSIVTFLSSWAPAVAGKVKG